MKLLLLAPCSPLWCEITLTLADRLNTHIQLHLTSFLPFENMFFSLPSSWRKNNENRLLHADCTNSRLPLRPKRDVCHHARFYRKGFRAQRVLDEWVKCLHIRANERGSCTCAASAEILGDLALLPCCQCLIIGKISDTCIRFHSRLLRGAVGCSPAGPALN